jgi:hypothetical protein
MILPDVDTPNTLGGDHARARHLCPRDVWAQARPRSV